MQTRSNQKVVALVAAFAAWTLAVHHGSAADTAVSSTATLPGAEAGVQTALLSSRPQSSGTCNDGEPGSLRGSDLAAAAKVFLKFSGLPDLTGEYRVNSEGDISIPVVGHVKVANTCLAALEQTLSKSVSSVMRREIYAAVEISEFRPVFVTGFVMRPGAQPWRPGMSILQSLAEAGGLYRALTADGGALLAQDVVSRWQQAVISQKMNLALLARYEALQNGSDRIEIPSKLRELVGSEEAKELIDAQIALLTDTNRDYNSKLQSIKYEIEITTTSLRELSVRAERLSSSLEIRRKYKKQVEDLQSKGMVRLERSMAEFAQVIDLEERLSSAKIEIDRARARIAKLQRDEVELREARKLNVSTETNKITRDIARLEVEINNARETYRQMTGKVPSLNQDKKTGREREKAGVTRYKIVRQMGGTPTTIPSDELALLRPGDILVVNLE